MQIIVGFVATQRAGSEEALAALEELDLAIGVFRDAIIHPFVKHGLVSRFEVDFEG